MQGGESRLRIAIRARFDFIQSTFARDAVPAVASNGFNYRISLLTMRYTIVRRNSSRLIASALALALWACGGDRPAILFRPPGNPDLILRITLVRNDSAKLLTLVVDSTKVCSESFDAFENGDEMSGMYKGHRMTAYVHTITSYATNEEITACDVTYDSNVIGDIELRKTKLP